jgi:hypothetical protein
VDQLSAKGRRPGNRDTRGEILTAARYTFAAAIGPILQHYLTGELSAAEAEPLPVQEGRRSRGRC